MSLFPLRDLEDVPFSSSPFSSSGNRQPWPLRAEGLAGSNPLVPVDYRRSERRPKTRRQWHVLATVHAAGNGAEEGVVKSRVSGTVFLQIVLDHGKGCGQNN